VWCFSSELGAYGSTKIDDVLFLDSQLIIHQLSSYIETTHDNPFLCVSLTMFDLQLIPYGYGFKFGYGSQSPYWVIEWSWDDVQPPCHVWHDHWWHPRCSGQLFTDLEKTPETSFYIRWPGFTMSFRSSGIIWYHIISYMISLFSAGPLQEHSGCSFGHLREAAL